MATADLLTMDSKKDANRQKALDSALAQIERQFGKGSIMKLGGDNVLKDIEATSTGSLGLDIALGIGGLPKGRIIEVYGPESSGKTTLTLHVVAEEQKKGGVCAFVDAEHALDPQYAKKLGVDLDELLISQPDTGEQALEIVDTLVRSNAIDVLVVDSVAALVPRALDLLDDASPLVRAMAVWALGRLDQPEFDKQKSVRLGMEPDEAVREEWSS